MLRGPQYAQGGNIIIKDLLGGHYNICGGFKVKFVGPCPSEYITPNAPLSGLLFPKHTVVFKVLRRNESGSGKLHTLMVFAFGGLEELVMPLRAATSMMMRAMDHEGGLITAESAYLVLWGCSICAFCLWKREVEDQRKLQGRW